MVNDELVERMLDAYWGERNWKNVHSPTRMESMTAALRVAAEALLGPVTDTERICVAGKSADGAIGCILALRRARWRFARTPEERVSIEDVPAGEDTLGGWAVHLDGKSRLAFASKSHAEIYRLGLMATLKEEQQ